MTDYGMQRERMASKERGELAEIRGQFDRLRHAEGEDGKQEEEEN